MKVKELVDKYNIDGSGDSCDIAHMIVDMYPDQKKNLAGYKNVLDKLKKKKPAKSKLSLLIEREVKDWDGSLLDQPYAHVLGKNGKGETYALDFTLWGEWLGMEIDNDTFKDYNERQVLSSVLFEITFWAWSEKELKEKIKDLNDTVEDIKGENAKDITEEDF